MCLGSVPSKVGSWNIYCWLPSPCNERSLPSLMIPPPTHTHFQIALSGLNEFLKAERRERHLGWDPQYVWKLSTTSNVVWSTKGICYKDYIKTKAWRFLVCQRNEYRIVAWGSGMKTVISLGQYLLCWTSLVVQMVKNLPAMQETRV